MHVRIGDRVVGDDAPCFIVAAVGSNHDGRFERALALVDAAAACGADAVKFHSHRASSLLARRARTPSGGWRPVRQYALFERLELPPPWHAPLRDHARRRGLHFLATPADETRAGLLAALGVPAFRVPSGDLTHLPLLECLGGFGRPILLSTGLAEMEEIAEALAAIDRGAGGATRRPGVTLLHCVGVHPLAPGDANLRVLPVLRREFGCLVGWSDHSDGSALSLGAVALGACVVERHLTDDPSRPGAHHRTALDPEAFRALVRQIRELELALGDGSKRPSSAEMTRRRWARRSVHAARSLPAGTVLEAADLKVVRPASGAPPGAIGRLVGVRTTRHLSVDEPIGDVGVPSGEVP